MAAGRGARRGGAAAASGRRLAAGRAGRGGRGALHQSVTPSRGHAITPSLVGRSLVARYRQATRASAEWYRQAQHTSATYQRMHICTYAHTHIYIIKSHGKFMTGQFRMFLSFPVWPVSLARAFVRTIWNVSKQYRNEKNLHFVYFLLAMHFNRHIIGLSDDDGRRYLI